MRMGIRAVETTSATIAALLALPVWAIFLSAILEIRFVETLKSHMTTGGGMPNGVGMTVLVAGLVSLPAAFMASLWPMLKKDAQGVRRFYVLNIVIALLVGGLMVPAWGGLLKDFWHCDILQIPNCD